MKPVKHLSLFLSLFLLSFLFTFVLPHFHNQAFADPTIDEFTIPTSSGDPDSITSGPDGNLWFNEFYGNKIGVITTSGTILHEYSVPTGNSDPFGITSGPDGNLWFTEYGSNKIGVITTSGTILHEYSVPTGNSTPRIITSGPDGNLWFTEDDGNKIGKITTSGTFNEYSVPTSNSRPWGITSGPDGNLWFTEYGSNKIGVITTSGTILHEYSVPTGNSGPENITSGPDGSLWFTENGSNKIGVITTSGTILHEYSVPTGNSDPVGITSGPDGSLWFTEISGYKIGQITTSGTFNEFPIPSGAGSPEGITIGSDGRIWFVESVGNKIGRVNNSRPPLIFIPGIMGSDFSVNQTFDPNIYDCINPLWKYTYTQGDTVWENINLGNVVDYTTCGKYLDVLKLQSDGQTPVYSQIGLKGTAINTYDDGTGNSAIGYLKQHGYTLGTNLFVFPYDWRKDIATNMTSLNNEIDQVIATASAGTTKVDIMAHSMGGLVARDYISDATRAQKVYTLVELGTPHAGSVDALANLLYPICVKYLIPILGKICVVNGNEANALAQNFTGGFELLPSRLYYTLYPNLYPLNDTRDIDNNGVTGPLNFDQTRTLLANLGKNPIASRTADLFHGDPANNTGLDSTYSNTNGVKTYLFAGSGKATIGQIFDYAWSNSGSIKHDAIATDGDGTVPLKSATLNNTSNVFFANEDHGGLVGSGPALTMAYNLLNGQTGLISGIQTTPFGINGQIISVHSPAQLDAYDSSNNHTGKNSDGSYEENIPGSEYYELGDTKLIFLPAGGHYNLTTKATAAGSFDLKVKNYTNSQIDKQTLFLNVSQTASTSSSLNLDNTSPVLSVDVNGDGTNIEQVSPNYTLTGSSATDYAPPVTIAKLSPNPNADGTYPDPVTVSLSATASAGFNVANMYYTKDGGAQQTYTSSFTVSGSGSHTITYWSIDSAGLTEAQNTKTFTIAAPTPTPTANLVLNGSFEQLTGGWANNWTKDSTSFSIDTSSNGNEGNNSLHLAPNTASANATSARINVVPNSTYTWQQYVNTTGVGGTLEFYVDEYDINGNWISGQSLGSITSWFTGNKVYSYTPSNNEVASIDLQYHAAPNSTYNLYIDSVSFSLLASTTNIAPQATVTASSQNTQDGQTVAKAVDSSPDGYPGDYTHEWVTQSEGSGAWLNLVWPTNHTISQITLYDRPNLNDQITAGTLTFSDGSTVAVGSLNNDGLPTTITFPARTVSSVRLTITGVRSSTQNIGLAEIQVFDMNIAPEATITASSQNSPDNQLAVKTVDGYIDGYPGNYTREWATQGEGAGAWLNLSWPTPQTINKIILYDRPNLNDQITSGTLVFSDASTIPVSALNNDGSATVITFPAKTTTSIRLNITGVSGSTMNIGLAEIQAFAANIAPLATMTASSQNTQDGQTAIKAVDGSSDGYPGDSTHEWASQGEGTGAWLNLSWSSAQTISKIVLYDRPNSDDQITSGTIVFSDNTSIQTGALNNDGTPVVLTFPAKTTSSIRLNVTGVSPSTKNIGLAEIETY